MKGSSSYVARSSFTGEMDSRAITPGEEELFVAHLDDIQLTLSPHMSTLCCETRDCGRSGRLARGVGPAAHHDPDGRGLAEHAVRRGGTGQARRCGNTG